jgi:hypothetical protein
MEDWWRLLCFYDETKAEKLKDIVFLGDLLDGHNIGFSKKGLVGNG